MYSHQTNILALDLQNTIVDNIESWFLESNLIQSDITKDYIRSIINNNQNSDSSIDYIFLANDIVLATFSKRNYLKINYSDFLMNDLMLLPPVSLTQLQLYRSVLIDWIFDYHKESEVTFQAIQSLQEFEPENYQFPNFTSCVCVIDASDLGFKLKDFYVPLNSKFRAIHQFFKTRYQTDKILKNVDLTRVFLLDNMILGYSFQMEGSPEEHFLWNIYLDDYLLQMNKISFSKPLELSVDSLLDKINLKGIQSLTETELHFLNNQKQT